MIAKARLAAAMAGMVVLSGCASVIPEHDIPRNAVGAPTLASIRSRIVCELEEIATGTDLERYISQGEDLAVTALLTLDVTDDGALAPTFTYTDGMFSFGTGFKLEQSREQNFSEQQYYTMRQIKLRAESSNWKQNCAVPPDTNLAGKIGLLETFDLAMTANPDLNWSASADKGVFGGYVTFINKNDLSATGPTWMTKTFKGPGSFGTLAHDHNDKLVFAFSKGKKADSQSMADARARGFLFINNLVQTQLAVSLNSISQALK